MTTAQACSQVKPGEAACNGRSQTYLPAVDVFESTNEVIIQADVPGAAADGLDVQFEDGQLRLHAKVAPRRNSGAFLLQEYGTGDYRRTFRVGQDVDASKIEARLADGVLTLTLPKVEAAKPRKIAVHVA